VPALCYDRDCTILLGTNTFLNGYARKAHAYDFRSLRYLFAAAEKLQEATAAAWSQRFGVRVLEGYGATECSPCLSVDTPLAKYGSVGKFLHTVRLEHVEGVADGGRLLVRGPNVMRGYLNPEANAHFKARGGWYDTGDIVRVDEDNYLFILGRLKRFAKISGEMVSLTASRRAGRGVSRFGLRCQIAIVSRPIPTRARSCSPRPMSRSYSLTKLFRAARQGTAQPLRSPRIEVCREIPKLGTGKVNRELEKLL
jgi:acyl-[acyl-carrier-protein]-phospholipid O-acyltransferase/long-chain-fatty-acid--[acyl-carrier-protein] ligase